MKAALDTLRSTLPTRALSLKHQPVGFKKSPHPDHIPLRVTGGIGDLILSIGPAEAIEKIYGTVVIYSKFPREGQLFTTIENKHEDELFKTRGFDYILNLNALMQFQFSLNFKGFKNAKLNDLLIYNRNFLSDEPWRKLAEFHPLLDNIMGIEGVKAGLNRYDITYASVGIKSEPFKRNLVLPRVVHSDIKYITVHDGFDANMPFAGGRAMKTWDMKHWKDLIERIHVEFPDYKVFQIGGPRSRRIRGVDHDFIGQSFRQSLGILQSACLHIDGESGLVHAAHVLGTKSVVLFGPTPPDFFGYKSNYNIAPKFCGGCWWLTQDWMAKCPVRYESPECMDSIEPHHVMEGVRNALYL